jgi:hypothetical protein
VALVGAPALLIGVLAWPVIFSDSIFNDDWLNHLWYLWHESLTIRSNHWPSLFLNYSHAVFYPYYAFNGGTLYALVGGLSLLLGNAPMETYIATYLMAFGAAYGGWYWMARMAGLGRWRAHAPGLVFITSAYYLTLIYGRGDWPELLGVSMIPMMVAAALSLLRAERLHAWPAVALVLSAIVFFGSHNITVLWGSTILAVTGLAVVCCVPRARREITRTGALRIVGLVIPALLVNAWFLLPAIAYQSQTLIGSEYANARRLLLLTMPLVSAEHLFTISRASSSSGVAFALSLPILVIAWVLAGIAILRPAARGGTWARMLLVICAVTVLIGVAMTHSGILLALPQIYTQLQFSYRLESYLLLGISGAVLLVLVLAQGRTGAARLWSAALAPVLCVSVVGAIQQADAYPPANQRGGALSSFFKPPSTVEGLSDYVDVDLPVLTDSHPHPVVIDFPPAAVHSDEVSKVVHLPPGSLYYTNIAGAPDLVHVTGAKIVGIDPEGDDVVRIDPAADPAPRVAQRGGPKWSETLSLSPAESLPVVAGRVLSFVGLAILVLGLVALALRGRRPREPSVSRHPDPEGRGTVRHLPAASATVAPDPGATRS